MRRLRGSPYNLVGTQRPRLALEGAWRTSPSFRTKRMHEGHLKKPGELLIALSLCAEARGLFLQPLTPQGSEKRDEKGHQSHYGPKVRRLGHQRPRQPPQGNRVRDNYGRARTWSRPRQAIAWDALSRVRDQQEFSKGDPTIWRHRGPGANQTALGPTREAL